MGGGTLFSIRWSADSAPPLSNSLYTMVNYFFSLVIRMYI